VNDGENPWVKERENPQKSRPLLLSKAFCAEWKSHWTFPTFPPRKPEWKKS